MDYENKRIHDERASIGGPETRGSRSHQRRHGCHANEEVQLLLDNLAGFIFGSCVSVVEVASNLVPDSWHSNTKSNRSTRTKSRHLDPRLAGLAGRYQSKSINPQEFTEGIPSFLEGDNMDYSFEEHTVFDDNISALSAYTLEEMARMNAHATMPVSRLGEKFSSLNSPPSVTRTNSSSSSSREQVGLKLLKNKEKATQGLQGSKTRR